MTIIKARALAKQLPNCRIILPDDVFMALEKSIGPEWPGFGVSKISVISVNTTRFHRRSSFNDKFGVESKPKTSTKTRARL